MANSIVKGFVLGLVRSTCQKVQDSDRGAFSQGEILSPIIPSGSSVCHQCLVACHTWTLSGSLGNYRGLGKPLPSGHRIVEHRRSDQFPAR